MKILFIGIITIIIIGGFVLIVNSMQNTQITPTQPTVIETPTVPVAPTESASLMQSSNDLIKTVEVESGSYYYKPNAITVKKDERVKIVMHSVSMMHDFNIDELNVKIPIVKNGDTSTVEFIADKVGTFEYYCSIGQHRQLGQVGKLIVE